MLPLSLLKVPVFPLWLCPLSFPSKGPRHTSLYFWVRFAGFTHVRRATFLLETAHLCGCMCAYVCGCGRLTQDDRKDDCVLNVKPELLSNFFFIRSSGITSSERLRLNTAIFSLFLCSTLQICQMINSCSGDALKNISGRITSRDEGGIHNHIHPLRCLIKGGSRVLTRGYLSVER